MKITDLDESWGRRSSYYNPMDQERDEQRQMDWERLTLSDAKWNMN